MNIPFWEIQLPFWAAIILTVGCWVILEGIRAAFRLHTSKAELEHEHELERNLQELITEKEHKFEKELQRIEIELERKLNIELLKHGYRIEIVRKRMDVYDKIHKAIEDIGFDYSLLNVKRDNSEKLESLVKNCRFLNSSRLYLSFEATKIITEISKEINRITDIWVSEKKPSQDNKLRKLISDLNELMRKDIYSGEIETSWGLVDQSS